jgi:hypothetical protein
MAWSRRLESFFKLMSKNFIPDPDFLPSWISDAKEQKRGGGKINLFCSRKFRKIEEKK